VNPHVAVGKAVIQPCHVATEDETKEVMSVLFEFGGRWLSGGAANGLINIITKLSECLKLRGGEAFYGDIGSTPREGYSIGRRSRI
jgi:hypothetical protein